jgi:hypothetical protein
MILAADTRIDGGFLDMAFLSAEPPDDIGWRDPGRKDALARRFDEPGNF